MFKRKRLAYISNSTIPSFQANSFHVINMAHELAKLFDVTLFSYSSKERDLEKFYGLEIIFKKKYFKLSPAPIFNFLTIIFFPILNFNQYDFFLGRNVKILCYLFLLNKKVILELHQPVSRHSFLERLLLKMCIKKGMDLVVISKKLKKIIKKEVDQTNSKISVLPDASRDFYQRKIIKENSIGYFGSLLPGRGLDIIFSIAKELPKFRFNIFGKENYYFQKFLKDSKTKNIFYHKFVNHTEIGKLMSQQSILIAPYQKKTSVPGGAITSEWMSPLKIFEYMSTKRPIISSNLPVLKEVLIHRENCMLVEPEDLNKWVITIKQIRSDKKLQNYIVRNAYKDFLKKYSWKVRAENYSKILKRMV